MFWWVTPSARGNGARLLIVAERWARSVGAVAIQMVSPVGSADVEAIYRARGYEPVQTTWQLRLAA
jgi:GNAT superfamily N-acetyltransferase